MRRRNFLGAGPGALLAAAGLAPARAGEAERRQFEDLLLTLIDAVPAAPPEAYLSGRAAFEVEHEQTTGRHGLTGSEFAGTATWVPAGARWEYDRTDLRARPDDLDEVRRIEQGARTTIVAGRPQAPRTQIVASPKAGWATVSQQRPADRLREGLMVRPVDSWFGTMENGFFRSWERELRPFAVTDAARCEIDRNGTAFVVSADAVRRAGGKDYPLSFWLAATLDDLPRITRFGYESPNGRSRFEQVQEWSRNPAGTLYPALTEATSRWFADDDPVRSRFRCALSDYTESPPRAPRLTLASLDLPKGTRITYRDVAGETVREEWVGGSPPPEPDKLDALAEKIRRGTFAGGRKDDE